MKLSYKVVDNSYTNVKEVLKVQFLMSDRLVLKLKRLQKISLNGRIAYINQSVSLGDIIECNLDYEEESENIVPTKMPLDIIYEDDCYLVINKPFGMVLNFILIKLDLRKK